MITATSITTHLVPTSAVSGTSGASDDAGGAELAADFQQELMAVLGAAAQALDDIASQDESPVEPKELSKLDKDVLQNLPMPFMASAMAPAIFATPGRTDVLVDGVLASDAQALVVPAQVMDSPDLSVANIAQLEAPGSAAVMPNMDEVQGFTQVLTSTRSSGLDNTAASLMPAQTESKTEALPVSPLPPPVGTPMEPVAAAILDRAVQDPGERSVVEAAPEVETAVVQSVSPLQASAEEQALRVSDDDQTSQRVTASMAPDLEAKDGAEPLPVGQKTLPMTEAPDVSISHAPTGLVAGQTPAVSEGPVLEPSHRLPVAPHQMRFDEGLVKTEVLKLVQQGGGQIVLELTPPDQGSYRLDLRLDAQGQALLFVEGASDSVRTRLELGEAVLREQLSQMGLSLQLNYRQQGNEFASAESSGGGASNSAGERTEASWVTSTADRRERHRVGSEGALIHLYA